jgi:hypothetical protein
VGRRWSPGSDVTRGVHGRIARRPPVKIEWSDAARASTRRYMGDQDGIHAIAAAVSSLAAVDPNPPGAFVRGSYRRLKVGRIASSSPPASGRQGCRDGPYSRPRCTFPPRAVASLHRINGEPQHFLNFFPLPQGHGELRPTLTVRAVSPGDGADPTGERAGRCRRRLACSPNCPASPGRPVSSHTCCSRSAMSARSRTPGTWWPRRSSFSARPKSFGSPPHGR